MLTDVQNSYTDRFVSKFAIKTVLNITPHFIDVATLPCEILRSENSDYPKRIVISEIKVV